MRTRAEQEAAQCEPGDHKIKWSRSGSKKQFMIGSCVNGECEFVAVPEDAQGKS